MNEMNESEIKYRLRGTQQNIFKETLDLPKAAVDGSFRIFGRRSVLFFDLDPNIVAELLELLVQLFDELDVVGGQTFEHVHNALWRFVWLVEWRLLHATIFETLSWMLMMRQLHRWLALHHRQIDGQ